MFQSYARQDVGDVLPSIRRLVEEDRATTDVGSGDGVDRWSEDAAEDPACADTSAENPGTGTTVDSAEPDGGDSDVPVFRMQPRGNAAKRAEPSQITSEKAVEATAPAEAPASKPRAGFRFGATPPPPGEAPDEAAKSEAMPQASAGVSDDSTSRAREKVSAAGAQPLPNVAEPTAEGQESLPTVVSKGTSTDDVATQQMVAELVRRELSGETGGKLVREVCKLVLKELARRIDGASET